MKAIAIERTRVENPHPFIQSCLYDLIEALNEETGFKEDYLITEAVLDLMKSGKILWANPDKSI